MKEIILSLILFICLGIQPIHSQTIRFELPAQKGKTLYLLAVKGTKQDTIFSGKINEKGNLVFSPQKDKSLSSGVVSLFIKPDINFDFIYSPKENMTLHGEGEYAHKQNTHFHNSYENDFMEKRYMEKMMRREKLMFTGQGMQLYKENEKIYNDLKDEKNKLEQEQTSFENMLQQESSNLYTARLMQTQNLLNEYVGKLQVTSDTAEYREIREYVLANLDTETLYRSGMWFPVINGMLELYYKQSPFYSKFGEDVVTLLQKTKSEEVFLALSNDAATICNQYSWNFDEMALSQYLNESGRVTNPQGKLKQMLMMYKLQPGQPAPAIIGTKSNTMAAGDAGTKTVIMFYESGCNNCENEMRQLIGNYSILQERGYDVISISADSDQTVYEYHSKDFPWPEKLCDFKGFEGENFKNYGVIGTPTIYVIDEKGIIQGKYARLVDTGVLN